MTVKPDEWTPEQKRAVFEFAESVTEVEPLLDLMKEIARAGKGGSLTGLRLTPKGYLSVHFDKSIGSAADRKLIDEAAAFCRDYYRHEMGLEILTAMGFIENKKP